MNTTKIITILVANAVIFVFAALGVAGLVGWLQIDKSLTITAIIAPCLGAAGTIYGAKHIFEDSEAVQKLRKEHAEEIATIAKSNAEAIARLKEKHLEETLKFKQTIGESDLHAANLAAENTKIATAQSEEIARLHMGRSLRP